MPTLLEKYQSTYIKASPLVVFRIFFGLLMSFSIVRFWYNGWIEKLYIEPTYHFKYYGFDFISVPPTTILYTLFILCGLSAFFMALGLRYRLSAILFFLSFTYIELMDKATYLNHYYFISVVAFMMIWLPANCSHSFDARWNEKTRAELIPRWNLDVIKVMLAIVYIYAGMAKLNYDWIIRAMPLTIWLPTKFNLPFLGSIMHEKWLHYFFSWGGAVYDLVIVFFLMWRRTRLVAFVFVLFFHIMTRVLFPIGMFPYIMIASTLIFFSSDFHDKVLRFVSKTLGFGDAGSGKGKYLHFRDSFFQRLGIKVLGVLIILQILLPLRYLVYPGNVFWSEEGYRFSWRVMLMEKTGYANFKIVDGQSGKRFYVQNEDFLTAFQQKQMSTQPDFIVQYGQYLGSHFEAQGHQNVEVYVESYASLNGRRSQQFIDPEIDLMTLKNNLKPRKYVLPLHE